MDLVKSFNFLIDKYPDLIDSSVHAFLAESHYELQGKFNGDVTSHVEKALYLNPSDTRALSLQGLNYFQKSAGLIRFSKEGFKIISWKD